MLTYYYVQPRRVASKSRNGAFISFGDAND